MIDSFFVAGLPAPQGSKFAAVRGDRAYVVDVNVKKLKAWRSLVTSNARELVEPGGEHLPAAVLLVFTLPRPKYHYGTGRNADTIKDRYEELQMTNKPDIDKLARAVLDGLTDAGNVFRDDSQVNKLVAIKTYGETPGCLIEIERGTT